MTLLDLMPARERFLPFRPDHLLRCAMEDPRLAPAERDCLILLAERLETRFHVDFRRRAQRLMDLYELFDPDRDTAPVEPLPGAELDRRRVELFGAFRTLLKESNYLELPRRQIVDCVELQNYGGLKVEANLDDYLDLYVFYRGAERHQRLTRDWPFGWRKRVQSCTIFRRAAVLVRTVDRPDLVYLKLFKDIVAENLEMVLPEVRVRMRWVDGLKISSGLVGSLATAAWKAFAAAVLLTPLLFMLTLGTFLAALVRAIFAYVSNKTRYMQALSANLYFQNLANDASVLTHLVDSAEAEETKEMLLAYFILYVERDRDYSEESLGRRVRIWVRDALGLDVDFEVGDALRKLIERGLVVERFISGDPRQWSQEAAEGSAPPPCRRVLKVYDLPSALARLDQAWDRLYPHESAVPPDVNRVADARWPVQKAAQPGRPTPG